MEYFQILIDLFGAVVYNFNKLHTAWCCTCVLVRYGIMTEIIRPRRIIWISRH